MHMHQGSTRAMCHLHQVSEEDDEPTIVDEARRGDYCVVFDPLVRRAPRTGLH